jgi:hypothetical protein
MANDREKLIIVDAYKMHGDLLTHFSSGKSVLYRAQFLWDIREQDPFTEVAELSSVLWHGCGANMMTFQAVRRQ